MEYRQRIADGMLADALRSAGAVLIEGPRACGKTATARRASRSEVLLDSDDAALAMVNTVPGLVLEGPEPRLIDEWQLAPRLWNHVRRSVDERGVPGQFILTGSATPVADEVRHAGAGRILRLRMRPMSLFESGHSTGEASLSDLAQGRTLAALKAPLTIPELAERIVVGGWPALLGRDAHATQRVLQSYLDDVAVSDVAAEGVSPVRRDPLRVRRFINAYARHVATTAALSTLARDTAGSDHGALRADTVREYLDVLERIWVVEEQPSWGPHMRSRDLVRKAAKRHFVDPSLAAAALGASSDRLLRDPNTFGLLFESLAVRDLRTYVEPLGATVYHYRDSADSELDAVVQTRDGAWIAIEVKLAAAEADTAAASINRVVQKVDTSRSGELVARIIITGGEYAYTRPDGVHVIPLSLLGP